jgi:hypothetical protein
MNARLQHDAAEAMAHALLDLVAPLLRAPNKTHFKRHSAA